MASSHSLQVHELHGSRCPEGLLRLLHGWKSSFRLAFLVYGRPLRLDARSGYERVLEPSLGDTGQSSTHVPRKTDVAARARGSRSSLCFAVFDLPRLRASCSVAEYLVWHLLGYSLVIIYLLTTRTLLFLSQSIHTTNAPTSLSQWPPNVSPTFSPTSLPAARALSSRCMRLPNPHFFRSHAKHLADRASSTAPLRTPTMLLSLSQSEHL
jgi:hypothetical protein